MARIYFSLKVPIWNELKGEKKSGEKTEQKKIENDNKDLI